MVETDVKRRRFKRALIMFSLCFVGALILLLAGGKIDTHAKTFTIRDPEDLKNINWKNAGYGPGHTYKIGADMTLGDSDDATVLLTKGKFTIDFNGHTVQNANHALTVFKVAGADVVMKDSKASSSKPSVRSYGAGAVQIVGGKLTIKNGVYYGASDGTNNPSGLHVGGGTCTVNGGIFYGDYVGASAMSGTLRINGGSFKAGYSHALMNMGDCAIRISKGNFYSGTTTYGFHFALGMLSGTSSYYDFSNWLAKGAAYSTSFQTGYWNMQASVTAYPTISNYWAVSYETPSLSVTNSGALPKATSIRSLKAGKNNMIVKWKKQTTRTNGYVVQYSTSKNFKNAKSVKIKGTSKAWKKLTKLRSGKKYYFRVRTYRSFNGTTLYSKWSKVKAKKVK